VSTRYFQATDGTFTVFRGTDRPAGFKFATFTTYGGPTPGVHSIAFSNVRKIGSRHTVEISKAAYAELTATKQARIRSAGGNPKWETSPQECWLRNSDLPTTKQAGDPGPAMLAELFPGLGGRAAPPSAVLPTAPLFDTREAWLAAATTQMRPLFATAGLTIPDTIRFAVAFPSTGSRGKRVGECWQAAASSDGHHTVIIRADLADETEVLAVLLHENIHAALPPGAGHGPKFRKAALSLGLTGKMTSTTPTASLVERLNGVAKAIGPLPHGRLDFSHGADDKPKKQSTRMLKAACECGYTIRLSRQWAEKGLPYCPVEDDHGPLICEQLTEEAS
jgi:hypothetical protein